MRRRVAAVLLLLIPVLILILFCAGRMQNQPVDGGNIEYEWKTSEKINSVSVSEMPVPAVQPAISDLLGELDSGIRCAADEVLQSLAKKENALGYYSNLVLANRCEQEGKDAAEYYRTALELYNTDEIRFRLADYLLKNGRLEEAENEYLALLPDEKALQALTAMKTNPEKICQAYESQKEWKALEKFLKSVFKENSEEYENITLVKYYARALAEQGNYKEAMPLYEKLHDTDASDLNIAWLYARCLEAAGQTSAALELYSSLGEKGAYRKGLILQKQGKNMEAAEAFESSSEPVALWQAARIWDNAGMIEKAFEIYTRIAAVAGMYQDDAAYRAYILAGRLGRKDAENKLLEVLTYHPAWMVKIGKKPQFQELTDINYQIPEYLKQAEIYEEEGYLDAAETEIAIGSKNTTLEEKLALGDWYLERGQYYDAVLWGIKSINEQPTRRGYELAYPQPYEKYVLEAAKKYNVEPALIWAVIREESHFRYDAVSGTGAVGLMQIMPSTAEDIASRMGTEINDGDLLKPEINIQLGTYYISLMLNMFDQKIDMALAAYNGGPGNVKKWLESGLMTSDEDFPTAVAFPETQEYITKVMNSYYIYKWLYE